MRSLFEAYERRMDVAGGSVVQTFAGSRTSFRSMPANGRWALWCGGQSQLNVVPVTAGECWVGSVVGMLPRPRTWFKTMLATGVPVNVRGAILVVHASCG